MKTCFDHRSVHYDGQVLWDNNRVRFATFERNKRCKKAFHCNGSHDVRLDNERVALQKEWKRCMKRSISTTIRVLNVHDDVVRKVLLQCAQAAEVNRRLQTRKHGHSTEPARRRNTHHCSSVVHCSAARYDHSCTRSTEKWRESNSKVRAIHSFNHCGIAKEEIRRDERHCDIKSVQRPECSARAFDVKHHRVLLSNQKTIAKIAIHKQMLHVNELRHKYRRHPTLITTNSILSRFHSTRIHRDRVIHANDRSPCFTCTRGSERRENTVRCDGTNHNWM